MPKIHVAPAYPEYELENEPDSYCFKEFTNITTLHGLKHAFAPRYHVFRRLAWMVFVLGMTGVLIHILIALAIDYSKYPTTTSVVISKKEEVDFPQVTLCNLSPFNASLLNASAALEKIMVAMTPLRYIRWDINISSPEFDFASEKQTREYFEGISFSLERSFLFCVYDSVNIACSDMFERKLTDMGMCFTMKSNTSMGHKLRSTRMTGSESGLELSLYFNQNNYVHHSQLTSGFKVFLHEPSEDPDTTHGFQISPGFSTHAVLKKTKYRHLPAPYKAFGQVECVDTKNPSFKNPLEFSDFYDVNRCYRECRAKYIHRQCGCVNYVDLGNYTLCSFKEMYVCYNQAKRTFRGIKGKLCKCILPCESTNFETQLSVSYSPSVVVQKYIATLTDENIRENYGELRIFYEYLTETIVEQQPVYDLKVLAATLGGHFGIFLGASVLTLTEILEYSLLKLWCYITCRKKKLDDSKPGTRDNNIIR